jgi:hypothetical protein
VAEGASRSVEHYLYLFRSLFPNGEQRATAARCFAESILAANAIRPNGWSVTSSRERQDIRLNVGRREILAYSHNGGLMFVVPRFLPKNRRPRGLEYQSKPGLAKSVPRAALVEFASEAVGPLYAWARDAHHRAIEHALEWSGPSFWAKWHQQAAVDVISKLSDVPLPAPDYGDGGGRRTFLLTWNGDPQEWHTFDEMVRAVRKGKRPKNSWRCMSTQVHEGDRLFWLRQRNEPRGIIASGYARGPCRRPRDAGTGRVTFEIDAIRDPGSESIIERAELDRPGLSCTAWKTAGSGVRIPELVASELERRWGELLAHAPKNPSTNGSSSADGWDSDTVPRERGTTDRFLISRDAQDMEAERREQKLVDAYAAYLGSKGLEVARRRHCARADGTSIICDLYEQSRRNLIEAKGSCEREDIRMAIGQLFDYARFEHPETAKAALLPEEPTADLFKLLSSAGVYAIWPARAGSFRDNAKGRFV